MTRLHIFLFCNIQWDNVLKNGVTFSIHLKHQNLATLQPFRPSDSKRTTAAAWALLGPERGGVAMLMEGKVDHAWPHSELSGKGLWLHLPSGKHTESYWKWWFIVDLPIEHGDFS